MAHVPGPEPRHVAAAPGDREFVFGDAEPSRGWMVLNGNASSLCMEGPSQGTDVVVGGTVRVWLAVWFGHRTYDDAVESGDLVVKGPAHLVPQVGHWFDLSPLAPLVAEHRAAQSDDL